MCGTNAYNSAVIVNVAGRGSPVLDNSSACRYCTRSYLKHSVSLIDVPRDVRLREARMCLNLLCTSSVIFSVSARFQTVTVHEEWTMVTHGCNQMLILNVKHHNEAVTQYGLLFHGFGLPWTHTTNLSLMENII